MMPMPLPANVPLALASWYQFRFDKSATTEIPCEQQSVHSNKSKGEANGLAAKVRFSSRRLGGMYKQKQAKGCMEIK